MFSRRLIWSTVMMVLLVTVLDCSVSGRSVESIGKIEKLLSLSGGAPSHSSLSPLANGHNLNKRAVYDQSCKGIYDRELFGMLDRVCEDCYNLYRKPYVGVECRANCYQNTYFRQCLDDLQMVNDVEKYVNAVQVVGR